MGTLYAHRVIPWTQETGWKRCQPVPQNYSNLPYSVGQAKGKESEESKSADLVLVASAFERDPWPGSFQEIMKVTVPFLSMIMESDPLSVRFFSLNNF